jgi:sigma-B regulation protein RsbU (phosphoserine phosphatase)
MMIGASDVATFKTRSEKIPSGSRLYVYSDGVSDIDKPDGGMLTVSGLVDLLVDVAQEEGSRVERVLDRARALQGPPGFKDDFSLVEVEFG